MVERRNATAESATSSIEVTLMSFGNLRVELMALQGEKCDTLAILHQENMWISDTGASTLITWNNKGARNVCDSQMLSLGHTGEAIKINTVIDIPGVFMSTNKDTGRMVALQECSYNKAYNFNLLSMSRLSHNQAGK
jgi:hypothetical protein